MHCHDPTLTSVPSATRKWKGKKTLSTTFVNVTRTRELEGYVENARKERIGEHQPSGYIHT
ncbi:hypothetical protein PAXRUDRAFT_822495 [Paxillus rubicundulus Ve08.2h10]|uniref:Uncharacterized protein n=1 Tax=Paxillus rubicundulus Ve08.2h10 TaxID=930991 RepID=A0A0D0ECM9_9AGAM|nr:hypothetical protein PAXRUDRAFT_822495 [Paxillus rubicundulus Ve08.2h10]